MPKRIQRKRRKDWRMPKGAVYVGRPTEWGNHYRVAKDPNNAWRLVSAGGARLMWGTRVEMAEKAVEWFRDELVFLLACDPDYLEPLRGKDLVCWCPLNQPCHADVEIELANRNRKNDLRR